MYTSVTAAIITMRNNVCLGLVTSRRLFEFEKHVSFWVSISNEWSIF